MKLSILLASAGSVMGAPFNLEPGYLNLEVFNPLNNSIFAVASEIFTFGRETILVDAQFEAKNARAVVDRIKATTNDLSLIYISHSDPDYYFGLDVIVDAYPNAKVIATQATVDAINATYQLKLDTWNPQLGSDAPSRIILPDPIEIGPDGYAFSVGHGHDVYLLGPQANRTVAYIPTIDTVFGGVPVTANQHVWMADTQTTESIQLWIQTLDEIVNLDPSQVIPGHYVLNSNGSTPYTLSESANFTRGYVETFVQEAAKASNSTQLVDAILKIYPSLSDESTLETSAKVFKGEMKWP